MSLLLSALDVPVSPFRAVASSCVVASRCFACPTHVGARAPRHRRKRLPRHPRAQPQAQYSGGLFQAASGISPTCCSPIKRRNVPQPNLANSPRIDSLMHDGKIYLSIDDAVALTLENNLDLDIARYNLNIADTRLSACQVGRQHSRREYRHRAEHSRRRRRRIGRNRRLWHRRHHRGSKRRWHWNQRLGQFDSGHRCAHHEF